MVKSKWQDWSAVTEPRRKEEEVSTCWRLQQRRMRSWFADMMLSWKKNLNKTKKKKKTQSEVSREFLLKLDQWESVPNFFFLSSPDKSEGIKKVAASQRLEKWLRGGKVEGCGGESGPTRLTGCITLIYSSSLLQRSSSCCSGPR